MWKQYIVRLILLINVSIIFSKCHSNNTGNICSVKDSLQWVSTSTGCLHIYTYKSDKILSNPNLVIVIHGDAPFNKPGYQYLMAKKIAERNSNSIAISLLRPGYTDPDGNTSDGKKGLTTGDNYTEEVINAISEAIEHFKTLYHPNKIILVGHSGGAAISADIIGLKPGLIDEAVIVSCPCNVSKWRNYMGKQQPENPAWRDSVKSISPIDVADKISKNTEVLIISGEKDSIAPTELSGEYYNKLKTNGIKSRLIKVPNKGHEILLNDSVFATLKTIISQSNSTK